MEKTRIAGETKFTRNGFRASEWKTQGLLEVQRKRHTDVTCALLSGIIWTSRETTGRRTEAIFFFTDAKNPLEVLQHFEGWLVSPLPYVWPES